MSGKKTLTKTFGERAKGDGVKYSKLRDFTLERVTSAEILAREWEPVLAKIFTDENDREPIELLTERMENGDSFFLMRDEKGTPVGIELAQVLPNTGMMYIPWTGVLEEHRNLGIGAHMNRMISEYMRDVHAVTHTLIDIEDPTRLHNSGYAPDEVDEAIGFAQRRITFWRRQDFVVVDDASKPSGQKLEYCRPASDDEQNIQAYDHMCIRFDSEELKKQVMSPDGKSVDKDFVRQCYLEMTWVQYGNHHESRLRKEYPAVDKYLRDIDSDPAQHLATHSEAVRPKTSPVAPVRISFIENDNTPQPAAKPRHKPSAGRGM